jgi:hypothetical protein
MKILIHILFVFAFTTGYTYAQKDSIKPIKRNSNYKFAGFAGLTVSTTKNLNTTYNPMMNLGESQQVDYKNRIFLNSFSNNLLIPYIGIEFQQNKQFIHSLNLSYLQKKMPPNDVNGFFSSIKKEQVFFHEYNFLYFFLANKSEKILPFIGATLSSSHKKIDDRVSYFYDSTNKYHIVDKSNLFLLQVPLGIRFTLNRFFIQANTTLSVLSYSIGSQKFSASSEMDLFDSEENKYSTFLFIDKLIKEKYFYQNVFELNVGYKF